MAERKMNQRNEPRKMKSFEKVLNQSSVPPNSSLFLPAPFVREHGDEFRRDVTLRSAKTGESFAVNCTINFPRLRPSVLFSDGWKNFAIANELAIGDHLKFELVAMSTFKVFINRRGGSSASSVPAQLPVRFGLGRQACALARANRAAIRSKKKADAMPATTAGTKLIKEKEPVVAPEAPQASSVTNFGYHGQLLGQVLRKMFQKQEDYNVVCEIGSVTKQGIPKGTSEMKFANE